MTFNVVINTQEVPIIADGIPDENIIKVINSTPFTNWITTLDKRFVVSKITLQNVDMFGPRVGFIKFSADATFDNEKIPAIVFMRGRSVAILPVLTVVNNNTSNRFVICCRQARFPVGKHLLEIPAGMMDDSHSFVGTAAKELKEETDITITEDELIDLTNESGNPDGIYPSPGGCDESISLMLYQKTVPQSFIDIFKGKITGNIEEHEKIYLELIPYEELHKSADMKALSAMLLAERFGYL